MATIVLSAVGQYFGGPVGSAIGAIVGNQIDSALFRGSREGPRLKELDVTTSSYGRPIPRNFGRMRVAGSVIWSTELIETSKKEGGGKGKPSTKTYTYSASFAVAVSSTPISRIGRIWADGNLLRGVNGDLKVEGSMRVYLGEGDNEVDPLIAADKGGSAPAFRDCAYLVFDDLQLADFGNRIPALTFEIFAPIDDAVSLAQLVPESIGGAGDVILHNARGFSDEGGSVGSTLAAIDRVFPLTCVTTGQGLTLTSGTELTSAIAVLPQQLSRADGNEAEERQKQRGQSLDREPLALRYYDENRDYQPGVQRALGMRAEGRESMLDLPAAMTASGARELANSNAHRARWRNETVLWRIGELDPAIGPGSVVRLPETNGFWRVASWEWFDRGIELSLDRLAPELGLVAPTDPGSVNLPVDLLSAPTLLSALEVPSDGTTNPSNSLILAVATSAGSGWRGAALFSEQAGTLVEIGQTGAARCVSGVLVNSLGPSNCAILEANAELVVDLPAEDLAFNSTDVASLAMGENRLMIGSEVIQFLRAEAIGPSRWVLSGLLRGRAGTEDAASLGHASGTSAILLNDDVTVLDPSLVSSGQDTRLAAIGHGDTEPVFADLRNVGLSRRPPMPVAPRNLISPDGSWEMCWTRRSRGHWRWEDGTEVPLVEELESYALGFGPTDFPHVSWTTSEARFELTQTQRDELIAAHGPDAIWVRQIGTFGQSSALLLAAIA